MRIAIWVRPGSARPGVGGEHDGALIVRVTARAVDGKIVDIDISDRSILAALLAAPSR